MAQKLLEAFAAMPEGRYEGLLYESQPAVRRICKTPLHAREETHAESLVGDTRNWNSPKDVARKIRMLLNQEDAF